MLTAEVVSIGDELTSGQNLDTNCQWLSQRLGELGVRVLYHTTVADDLDANIGVFRAALERADLVISSGGLGPTADDLTRDAIAAAANVELMLDEKVLAWLGDLFQRRGRPMPERNRVQAFFPHGSRVINNPHGTAPGIDLEFPRATGGKSRVFALPGVPAEMKEMWEQTVLPAIRQQLAQAGGELKVIRHKKIKCFGVGESDLEKMLPDLIRRGRYPQVGITVSGATISLRITTAESSAEACEAAMQPTLQTIHDCLGTIVFGQDEEELQHPIFQILYERRQTVSVVECGTAGLIATWLADVDPNACVFRGGLNLRNAEAVSLALPLQQKTEDGISPASADYARMLAVRCREKFQTDYSIAVGPFPTFDPQAAEPAQAHFALASSAGVEVKSSPFAAHPDLLKVRAAKQALNLLRLNLLKA